MKFASRIRIIFVKGIPVILPSGSDNFIRFKFKVQVQVMVHMIFLTGIYPFKKKRAYFLCHKFNRIKGSMVKIASETVDVSLIWAFLAWDQFRVYFCKWMTDVGCVSFLAAIKCCYICNLMPEQNGQYLANDSINLILGFKISVF